MCIGAFTLCGCVQGLRTSFRGRINSLICSPIAAGRFHPPTSNIQLAFPFDRVLVNNSLHFLRRRISIQTVLFRLFQISSFSHAYIILHCMYRILTMCHLSEANNVQLFRLAFAVRLFAAKKEIFDLFVGRRQFRSL